MSSLLSGLTSQVTGPLVRAGLLPATIFTILLVVFAVPLAPESLALFERFGIVATEWEVAAVSFAVLVMAGLLYAMSTPVIRLYEGYPWRQGWIGRVRTRRHQARFRALESAVGGLRYFTTQELTEKDASRDALWDRRSGFRRELRFRYPERADLVLPTRLGNVIRSFERYPSQEYGMESIVLWPRMQSVIEPGYASGIDNARLNLSFLLNLSLLLTALALILAVLAVQSPHATVANAVIPALAAGLSGWLLYQAAIRAAVVWGYQVEGAFDLYRLELLEKLGFAVKPGSRREERAVWRRITQQMIFGDDPPGIPRVDPKPAPGQPVPVLSIGRGVRPGSDPGVLEVVVSVRNDGSAPTGPEVSVRDTPPDGHAYLWGSASSTAGAVRVEGTGPHTFHVAAPLQPEDEWELRYLAVHLGNDPRVRRSHEG